MSVKSQPPKTMKVAIAAGFGEIDENIFVRNDWSVPTLDPEDSSHLIIKVLACALAPGDVRVLSGKTALMQLPKGGFPYVIGSDVSGIVVVAPKKSRFQVGEYVVSRFDEPKPHNGVAEYRLVKTELTEKCPKEISPLHACGLPASAMAAKKAVQGFVKRGDRVLLIGASGGVGTTALQYIKLQGASFIAAVTTQHGLAKRLGADRVIDYRKEKWWEMEEFKANHFNVVIDLVNGDNWKIGGHAGTSIHRNGCYVSVFPGVETEVQVRGAWDILRLVFTLKGRKLWSRLNPRLPKWTVPTVMNLEDGDLKKLFEDVAAKKIQPILDSNSPFEFTEEGVRKAMHLQKSCHAHGKVVIQIGEI